VPEDGIVKSAVFVVSYCARATNDEKENIMTTRTVTKTTKPNFLIVVSILNLLRATTGVLSAANSYKFLHTIF
jgi:hypothetical protein